jgi:hypothetical protein
MPDDSPGPIHPRKRVDGNWEASCVVSEGQPKRLVLVIEHDTADGESIVGIPLTDRRARAVIELLQDMLAEVGEGTADAPAVDPVSRGTGVQAVRGIRSRWVSLKAKKPAR